MPYLSDGRILPPQTSCLSYIDSLYSVFVEEKLSRFLDESKSHDEILLFPPTSSYHRFLIHQLASKLPDLKTVSVGEGHNRRTVVYFKPIENTASYPRKSADHQLQEMDTVNASQMDSRSKSRAKRPERELYIPKHRRQKHISVKSSLEELVASDNMKKSIARIDKYQDQLHSRDDVKFKKEEVSYRGMQQSVVDTMVHNSDIAEGPLSKRSKPKSGKKRRDIESARKHRKERQSTLTMEGPSLDSGIKTTNNLDATKVITPKYSDISSFADYTVSTIFLNVWSELNGHISLCINKYKESCSNKAVLPTNDKIVLPSSAKDTKPSEFTAVESTVTSSQEGNQLNTLSTLRNSGQQYNPVIKSSDHFPSSQMVFSWAHKLSMAVIDHAIKSLASRQRNESSNRYPHNGGTKGKLHHQYFQNTAETDASCVNAISVEPKQDEHALSVVTSKKSTTDTKLMEEKSRKVHQKMDEMAMSSNRNLTNDISVDERIKTDCTENIVQRDNVETINHAKEKKKKKLNSTKKQDYTVSGEKTSKKYHAKPERKKKRETKLVPSDDKDNNTKSIAALEAKDTKETSTRKTSTLKTLGTETRTESLLNSWEDQWDDEGQCLDPKTMKELEELTGITKPVVKKCIIDYHDFTPDDIDISETEYGHIIEINGFSSGLKTSDICIALSSMGVKDYNLEWVDDTHALAVFPSAVIAGNCLSMTNPLFQIAPISKASRQSKLKARLFRDMLLPYKERPQTTAFVARNMVASALGIRSKAGVQQRAEERKRLKEAREKKKQKEKAKADIWGD